MAIVLIRVFQVQYIWFFPMILFVLCRLVQRHRHTLPLGAPPRRVVSRRIPLLLLPRRPPRSTRLLVRPHPQKYVHRVGVIPAVPDVSFKAFIVF